MKKGWVREGILSGLSAQPATVTELARSLGVSKSTASYHLSLLAAKGVVEIVDPEQQRGNAQTKRFGLREGSSVTLLSRTDEEAELARIRETFDLTVLSWERSLEGIDGQKLQGLLYRMFLHLFRMSRSEHPRLLREYGSRAGAVFASHLPELPLSGTLAGLTVDLARRGISDSDLLALPGSSASVIASNTCIGSTFHPSNACYFLEGMIEGSVRAKSGPNVRVERIAVAGISSCFIAVGRARRFDTELLADSVLRSASFAAMGRASRRG